MNDDELRKKVHDAVDRMYDVAESKEKRFVDLFRISGLRKDALVGRTIDGIDLRGQDFRDLDFTGTKLVNCKIDDDTQLPDSYEPDPC